jgi:hypothetical protein
VDNWLLLGKRQIVYETLDGLVDELGKCAEGLREGLKRLEEDAGRCRPNFVLKRLLESLEIE